jgi:3-hydroxyisobutyrate dehydrogenase
MVRRLKSLGYSITGLFDIYRHGAEDLAKEIGSQVCSSLEETTASAEVIFTVVTDDKAQIDLFSESGDSLLIGSKGKIFINCATVSPEIHMEIARRCHKNGSSALEACMAPSISQALQGTLYLMCGGKKETFDSVRPLLEGLSDGGKLLRYIGPTGEAAKLKALVNMVMNINTAGLAEGLGLASSLGLDLKLVTEVFSQTGASSRVLTTDGDDMINRDHVCYFSAAHAAKDSGIALKLAQDKGLKLPLASATKIQYDRMIENGLGQLDKSAISELTFLDRIPTKSSIA